MQVKKQTKGYAPVKLTLLLESREEYNALWDFVEKSYPNENDLLRRMLIDVSNELCEDK